MIIVVYWLYDDPWPLLRGPRGYTAEHVNAQLPMLARWMPGPYRVVCVTDKTDGLDANVEAFPMPCDDGGHEPDDRRNPSCLRKLWNFSDAAREIGDRLLCLDLDTVIRSPMTRVVDRDEPLVVLKNKHGLVLGACYLLSAGTHTHVWDEFSFTESPEILRDYRLPESDQGWMTYALAAHTPSFGNEVFVPPLGHYELPEEASIVTFGTPDKPWTAKGRERHPWIAEHYSLVA